ncbi:hypothetical protein BpHYR1_044009 [Brachionus plicatilis]|uniref:Uncharacterized protein n=1 Tax=Brachionus plicatilis TaxID=10195 RepID=A0A3M7PU26_BRAPC|nr:hypothetical protein BpHYR1_044009 [Brachionus plicatilis]
MSKSDKLPLCGVNVSRSIILPFEEPVKRIPFFELWSGVVDLMRMQSDCSSDMLNCLRILSRSMSKSVVEQSVRCENEDVVVDRWKDLFDVAVGPRFDHKRCVFGQTGAVVGCDSSLWIAKMKRVKQVYV